MRYLFDFILIPFNEGLVLGSKSITSTIGQSYVTDTYVNVMVYRVITEEAMFFSVCIPVEMSFTDLGCKETAHAPML